MSSQSTDNVLSDFDICLAVTQQAINSQMEYAWEAWKRRQNFQNTISIFKKQKLKDGPVESSKSGMEVTFAPLEVNLVVKDGRLGQVEVKLKMTLGKITYFDDGELKDCDFKDVTITFVVDLDRNPCDLDVLKAIDPKAHVVTDEMIKASGLPDSVFSIEYLFLKFSEIDLEGLPENHFGFEAGTPTAATSVAKTALNLLLWGKLAPGTDKAGGKFILGSVVRRNAAEVAPTFCMTDFLFDVNPNWTAPEASTLNYLGVFEGRTLPADRNAARLKVREHWVQPAQIDGTEGTISGVMGIRKGKFMDDYLIPEFTKALKLTPQIENLKWKYEQNSTLRKEDTVPETNPAILNPITGGVGILVSAAMTKHRIWNTSYSQLITLEIQPGTNQLQISGQVSSSVHYDGAPWIAGGGTGSKTEWYYVEGYIPLTGTCTFIGQMLPLSNPDGSASAVQYFSLKTEVNYSFGNAVTTKQEHGGLDYVSDFFEHSYKAIGLLGKTSDEILTNACSSLQTQLKQVIDAELATISVEMSQHAFIPPGGGVFTFQKPIFTGAGDLLLEVIYKAP